MFSAAQHRNLVSGIREGWNASVQRSLLKLATYPYRCGVAIRNWRYDHRWLPVERVEVPVVSVGNMTVGGTGKTPFVRYLARHLRSRQIRVSIISRGYKSLGGMNDEARELAQSLPDVPHVQQADRVAAARIAIDELETEWILLDDGFQHRRLARDLDIVLIDALQPFGFGDVLPRGLLREPLRSLRRADVIALSRSGLVDAGRRNEIEQEIRRWNQSHLWIELDQQVVGLQGVADLIPTEKVEGKRILAFCGIGNPAGFQQTLRRSGLEPIELREFPDHHHYTRDDIRELQAWGRNHRADVIVCTHKDQVKILLDRLGDIPLRALRIDAVVSRGEVELQQSLSEIQLRATP